jgi:hypothetical protein
VGSLTCQPKGCASDLLSEDCFVDEYNSSCIQPSRLKASSARKAKYSVLHQMRQEILLAACGGDRAHAEGRQHHAQTLAIDPAIIRLRENVRNIFLWRQPRSVKIEFTLYF